MRRAIYLTSCWLLIAACADAPDGAGRHRLASLDMWIADRQTDSVYRAASDRVAAIRPGTGLLVGELAKQVIAEDSTTTEGRTESVIREYAASVVETGKIQRDAGPPFVLTRVWTVEDAEWRLVLDAVSDPDPKRGQAALVSPGATPEATREPSDASSTDSVSVEETIAAALRGDWAVRETLRSAAQGCGNGADSWQRRVVEEIVSRPPESLAEHALATVAGSLSLGQLRCNDLGVTEWIRSAMYVEMSEYSYLMMLTLLDRDFSYDLLRGVAADEDADPQHRLWVTERLVGGRPSRDQTVGQGGLTDRIAEHYRFNGVPPIYVDKWVPMLLAAPETREAAARDLIEAVAEQPDRMGGANIMFLVAANVEAYDYRFSSETRTVVAEGLNDMVSRRDSLSSGVATALDAAVAARSARRNHLGVSVQRRPLRLEFAVSGQRCVVAGPDPVVRAVNEVAPDFHLPVGEACRTQEIRRADFDGDGAEDGLLRGVAGDRTVLLAVLTGSSASAHIISPMGGNDWGYVQSPGTFRPACDGLRDFVFPTDWIAISFDEKFSANFRFDGGQFERLMGDEC